MRHDRRLATLLLLVAALMTAYAMPAVAGSHDDTPGDDRGDDASDNGDPPEDAGRSDRAPAGVGHVSQTDDAFDGRFVAGNLTGDGVANLSYDGTMLFDAVSVTNLTVTKARIDGARIRIEGETGDEGEARLEIHDSATAFSRFEVEDAELILDVADGAQIEDAARGYNITHDNVTARLWLDDGELTLDNGTLSASGDVEVKLLVSPSAVPGQANVDEEVAEAAAQGRVGAEVRMSRAGDTVQSQVARFSNISVLGSQNRDGVVLIVSSPNATGRTVVLHLDRGLFEDNATGELEIRFDGEAIGPADDLQDVLDARSDEAPEFVTVEGADEVQILVGIPSFSPHTVEVASLPGEIIAQTGLSLAQIAMAGVAAAATVAVAAGVAGKR